MIYKNLLSHYVGYAPLTNTFHRGRGVPPCPFLYINVAVISGVEHMVLLLYGMKSDVDVVGEMEEVEEAVAVFADDLSDIRDLVLSRNPSATVTMTSILQSLLHYSSTPHFLLNNAHYTPQLVMYSPFTLINTLLKQHHYDDMTKVVVEEHKGNILRVTAPDFRHDAARVAPHTPLRDLAAISSIIPFEREFEAKHIVMDEKYDSSEVVSRYTHFIQKIQFSGDTTRIKFRIKKAPRPFSLLLLPHNAPTQLHDMKYDDDRDYFFTVTYQETINTVALQVFLSAALKRPNCYLLHSLHFADVPREWVEKTVTGVMCRVNRKNVLISDHALPPLTPLTHTIKNTLNGRTLPNVMFFSDLFDDVPHSVQKYDPKKYLEQRTDGVDVQIKQLYHCVEFKKDDFKNEDALFAALKSKNKNIRAGDADVKKAAQPVLNALQGRNGNDAIFDTPPYHVGEVGSAMSPLILLSGDANEVRTVTFD